MLPKIKILPTFVLLTLACGLRPWASAQESAKPVETGTFHGKVHQTSGRATISHEAGGQRSFV